MTRRGIGWPISRPLAALILLSAPVWLRAQSAPGEKAAAARRGPSPLSIHKTTGEVVVDLVVNDAHGKIVRHPRPGELQVLDDRQPQTILSFRRIPASVHLTRGQWAQLGRLRQPARFRAQPFNLVALVFDRIGPAGEQLAEQAARALVLHDLGPRDYAAVFAEGKALDPLQNFTRARPPVLRAIAAATHRAGRDYRNRLRKAEIQMLQVMQSMQVMEGKQPGPNLEAITQALATDPSVTQPPLINPYQRLSGVDLILTNLMARSLLNVANMQREQRSWSSLTGLERIVRALAPLPGRKEVAYFSQSLPVNNNTAPVYRALVREANRAGVSFYPVDPQGLSVKSGVTTQADNLSYATAVSYDNATQQNEKVSAAKAHEFNALTNAIFSGRLTMLAALAADTGGFLSAHSNDLGPDMRRLAGDLHYQYELTYSPAAGMDGTYHTLAIRVVGHPDWTVRARQGYYAIPRTPTPVAAYALPALALLLRGQPKHDFPIHVASYQFPENPARPTLDLVALAPLRGLKAHPASRAQVAQDPRLKGRELLHLVILQLVRDRRGRIVRNFSRQYEWSAPAARWAQIQAKTIVLHRAVHLPRGDYTEQTAIYEPHERAASVASEHFQVTAAPAAASGQRKAALRLSSIVPVTSALPMRAMPEAYDPFNLRMQGQMLRLFPSAGEKLRARQGQPLNFYFIVYAPKGAPPVHATLNFFRQGLPFAGSQGLLPPPDAHGRIPYLARIDSAGLAPGPYQLQVKVDAGKESATGTVKFIVGQGKNQ